MNSANAGKTAQAFAEKDLLNATYLPTSNPANGAPQLNLQEKRPKRAMMSRLQHICFVVFALAVLAVTLVGASTSGNPTLSAEAQQFRDLLDTLDATTLHEILHEHFKDKYQHGVYQEDKSALEALHRQNAAVAQSLVQLAKRQDGTNGSITTTTAVETTTTEITQTITSTSTPPVIVEPTPTPTPTPTVNPPPTTTPSPTTLPPVVIPETSTPPSIPPPASTTTSSPAPPPESSTTTQASSSTPLDSSSVASTLVSSTTPARTSTLGMSSSEQATGSLSSSQPAVQSCMSMDSHPSTCNCAMSPVQTSPELGIPGQGKSSNNAPNSPSNSSSNASPSSPSNSPSDSNSDSPSKFPSDSLNSPSNSSNATLETFPNYGFNSSSGTSFINTSSPSPSPGPTSSPSSTLSSMSPNFFSPLLPPYPNTTSDFNLAIPTGSSASSRVSEEDVTTSIVYTTTRADGAVIVTTAITRVPADQVTRGPTGSGGPSTNTANASLQTGLAVKQYQLGGWTAGAGFLGMAAVWGL